MPEPTKGRIVRAYHPKAGWPEDGLVMIISKVDGGPLTLISGAALQEDGSVSQLQRVPMKGADPDVDEYGFVWDWPPQPPAA